MKYFRRQQRSRFFLCIIATAILLRSFIAPGYMLRTSAEEGFGIIFCDGPVTVNIKQNDHTPHQHHGDDTDVNEEVHISPVCSQWSTSSQLVFHSELEPVHPVTAGSGYFNHYKLTPYRKFSDPARIIRGPPVYV